MPYRTKLVLQLLFCLGLASYCGELAAACSRPYTVFATPLGFYAYKDEQATWRGIAVDMFNQLAERSGCQILLGELPFIRQQAMYHAGKITMMVPVSLELQRSSQDLILPLFFESTDLVVHENQANRPVASILNDPKTVFGLIRGASYGTWTDNFIRSLPKQRIEYSGSVEDVLRKVAAGHNQATFGFPSVYRLWTDGSGTRLPLRGLLLEQTKPTVGAIALSRRNIEAKDLILLANTLKAMRDDGSLEKIASQYLGAEDGTRQIWHPPPVLKGKHPAHSAITQ